LLGIADQPMLRASASVVEVTTFHAIRPPERWSRLSIVRAIEYGGRNVVDIVAPRPRWVVAAAAAETTTTGSR
jgi:hypothetical protein